MVERAPNLSPPSKPPLCCIHLVRLRGVLMRRREAGPGCGARGSISQDWHPGGAGAPPGSTTRPCQELADDREVYIKRDPSLSRGERIRIKRRDGPAGHLRRKRGPALSNRRKCSCCAIASLHERVWRAGRRPRGPRQDRDTIGLRLSARHPLTCEGQISKPRTPERVAARRTHVSSPSPFPPCDLRASPQDRGGKALSPQGRGETCGVAASLNPLPLGERTASV